VHQVTRLDGTTLMPSEWPLRRALARGEIVVGEKVRYRSPLKGEVTVVLSAAPVRDSSGEIFAAVGTLQQESESELLMRTLAESIPALVWRTDAEGRLEFLNGLARRFFGPEGGIARDTWIERLHPDDREHATLERARAVRRQEPFDLQYRMRDDGGEYRWFYTLAAPVREGGAVVGWVGTALDVTDRMVAENEMRRVAAFTEELLAIVGHDLRDPLNIVLLATALLRTSQLSDEQRKPVARIASAADRAVRILETLLDFTQARIGGGIKIRRAPMDLAALCGELAAEQDGMEVQASASGDCTGSWDRARLEQLLGNLIRNAVEHGAPGRRVELRCRGEGDLVILSVRNFGVPIAPELLPTLFEPFKRGARGSGSRNLGLGLYIVRQIAVAHGGTVEANSSAGDGTEFRVLLPR
jgi:PAS domain S-box-containing protein